MPTDKYANRAAIFNSFDSLKGYKDYIKAKERIIVPRKILSDDDYAILNEKMNMIKEQMMVTIIYYDKTDYVAITGIVTKIDANYTKTIQIVKTKIKFCDIVDIEFID